MAFETRKSNLMGMAQGLSIRIDCIHDKSQGFATDHIFSSLEQAYSHGRSDCLQEIAEVKKPLLPHELRLIEKILDDFASGGVARGNLHLPDTQHSTEMVIAMYTWENEIVPSGVIEELKQRHPPYALYSFMVRYMAHRVREALAEEES